MLEQMEKHGKAYSFSTFSSAETLVSLGSDFVQRLGINFIWIGVESKADLFEKTKGIDLNKLITDLQDHGISVLASAILFLEHHDKESIHEDIDWAIGLESDLLQFMELGPNPGTSLYRDYEAAGKIMKEIPWARKHGQDEIWFHHPHFTLPETASYLRNAFIKKYSPARPRRFKHGDDRRQRVFASESRNSRKGKAGIDMGPGHFEICSGQRSGAR